MDVFFHNSVDQDLNTVGNWWLDNDMTTPASALPGAGDTAFIVDTQLSATTTISAGTCLAAFIGVYGVYGFIDAGWIGPNATFSGPSFTPLNCYADGPLIAAGVAHVADLNPMRLRIGPNATLDLTTFDPPSLFSMTMNDLWTCVSGCEGRLQLPSRWLYAPSSAWTAALTDVRQGVVNINGVGTLVVGGGGAAPRTSTPTLSGPIRLS